jgi:hypothetical protein
MIEFLKTIILFFQSNNIDYMLSGSVALSVYVVPRATRDFDFVVQIKNEDVDLFVNSFREGYYCDADAIKDAIKHSGMFNIIDHASGFKADFIVLKNQPFRKAEFERRTEIDFLDMQVFVVTPEDLLISKLIWIQDFQSALQIEDIKSLKQLPNIDLDYIKLWAKKLQLNTFNLI